MVCRAGQMCTIQFSLFNGNLKDRPNETTFLHESTRAQELYNYVEQQCNIQQDSFKLCLLFDLKLIDLSDMKDKTMSEIGVDFSFNQQSSEEPIHSLFVMNSSNVSSFTPLLDRITEYGLSKNDSPSFTFQFVPVQGKEDNVDSKNPVKIETNYVGLVNQAMTCYLNSLLQALYMTPEFRNALYNWEYKEGSEKDEANSIPYQLQKLFLNLQTSTKSAVETTALTKSFGWDSTEAWQQHDIQELCRVMFDALEQKFRNTKQADLINRLYEGEMIDYVKCLECETEKSRADAFLDIPLPIRPFGGNETYNSVEEALKAFVQYETLEGVNQYYCEKCNKKCDAHKGLKFTKFPYLLTLHLKRFDFDFKTFHRIKLNDKVTFPDILNLNPFITSTPSAESPTTDQDISLVKSDDNLETDNGTLDSDSPPDECTLSNSNHSTTNHDQDDDEGIGMSNGPSTSNYVAHNHENEKNRNGNTGKGPYNYELFSIMIHSGSASGGHYYAYIKDFRTQEWLCFNDQNVTQITHDDIQKTYGGGPTRLYFSSASCSTNAYMLMYRQIDPVRNTLPMQVQDFPKHIKELLDKMNRSEDDQSVTDSMGDDSGTHKYTDKIHFARRGEYTLKQRGIPAIPSHGESSYSYVLDVYFQHPNESTKKRITLTVTPETTLAEILEYCRKNFLLERIVTLNQCRLVAYEPDYNFVSTTFEYKEEETIASILSEKKCSLLLEIKDVSSTDIKLDKIKFDDKGIPKSRLETFCGKEPWYRQSGIRTTVYVVNIAEKKLEGPINVHASLKQTVKEYKRVIARNFNINSDEMKIVLQKDDFSTVVLQDEEYHTSVMLLERHLSNHAKLFVCTMYDNECNDSFFEKTVSAITEQLKNIITFHIILQPVPSKERLEELNIPMLEEVYKDKENSVTDSPSNVRRTSKVCVEYTDESYWYAGAECDDLSKNEKLPEDTSVRNSSPQLGDGEEWQIGDPEQSNSEDSSLSDSDRTLVGDASEDVKVDLRELMTSYMLEIKDMFSNNHAVEPLNQVIFDNWDNMDNSEYYFKAIPYTEDNKKFLKVLVGKSVLLGTLKKNLEPYVGVPAEYFKIFCGLIDEIKDDITCQYVSKLVKGEKLWIDIRHMLRPGEFAVKVYHFVLNKTSTAEFLFEWSISEDMTGGQVKKEILSEMKKRYGIDIPYERCRLREKVFTIPQRIIFDHQRFKDFDLDSDFDLFVQELPEKDPITNVNQKLVEAQRWLNAKERGPRQEIVLDEVSVEELVKKISAISDIPEDHIEISKPYEPKWFSLTSNSSLSIEDDGELFLYRVIHPGITFVDYGRALSRSLPPSSASRYNARKEKALRIYLDGE